MIDFICWCEDLALIDAVHIKGVQNSCFCKMTDASLGHHWDFHCVAYLADHLRVTHAGDATIGFDVCGNALECHYRARSSSFCNEGLLHIDHIHDDSTLQEAR